MITKQHPRAGGTRWTLGSTWLLLPFALSPPACPLTLPAGLAVSILCLLSPPASSSVLLLPLARSTPHLVQQVITPGDFLVFP